MARRLSLQAPVVFEPMYPPFLRRLAFLAVVAPGVWFGYMATLSFSGVVLILVLVLIAILALGLCYIGFEGLEGKIIIDADGAEFRTPLNKVRVQWSDELEFKVLHSIFGSGVTFRTYKIISGSTTVPFGENLRNHEYLLKLVDAGVNGVADSNSIVHVPPPPPEAGDQKLVESFMLTSFFLLIAGLAAGGFSYDDTKKLYFTPIVGVGDAAKYADKDTEIRVKGNLHSEPPVVSRDGKHSYSFQFVQLGHSAIEPLVPLANPAELQIVEGSNKLAIDPVLLRPSDFGERQSTVFQKDWQSTDVGKMVSSEVDEHFKEYEKRPSEEKLSVYVWNVEQDQPAEVLGKVKTEKNVLVIHPRETTEEWLSPDLNKTLETWFYVKIGFMVVLLALSIYFFVVASAEAKKVSVR